MKFFRPAFLFFSLIFFSIPSSHALWVWTPETNKWVNPKNSVKETPKKQLDYALDFYHQKQYKKAIDEFKKLNNHYPKAREAADSQYYIGRCLEDEGNLFEAYKNYQIVIKKYPFSERSSEIVKRQFDVAAR